MQSAVNLSSYRLAVVFSKFELPEMWLYRFELEKFMSLRFPRTKIVLQQWSQVWGCSLAYFTCSAFGTMGDPPRPNFQVIAKNDRGVMGVLRNPSLWKPFGLLAPIYWLSSGKQDALSMTSLRSSAGIELEVIY